VPFDVSTIIKVTLFAICIGVLTTVLEQSNRKEYVPIVVLLGMVAALGLVIKWVNDLFNTIRAMLQF
jgi:stage III sporulation protein AC